MPKLTEKQTEKYSRQIIIEKIGMSGQKKIFNSSICIVGCGGLGSSASQYLSMSGVGNIMLIDHDLINLSNLNRQTLDHCVLHRMYSTLCISNRVEKISNCPQFSLWFPTHSHLYNSPLYSLTCSFQRQLWHCTSCLCCHHFQRNAIPFSHLFKLYQVRH